MDYSKIRANACLILNYKGVCLLLNKDLFFKKYGFYSYEEMVSENGAEIEKDGTIWFALKRIYEANRDLLQRLQQVTTNIVIGNR